ncbi:MAG: hypothetical protein IJ521_11075 [Schwartzia sp.]|nr:hypothetical protein [Schwartzia sp. (in: firmicutes)]
MATRDFVPRADGEGSIGTAAKNWKRGYFKELTLPDDGKKEFLNELVGAFFGHSAGSHNALPRGKDLTSYYDSGEMSAAIAAETFDDIFPGDYIIKSITIPAISYQDDAGNTISKAAQTFANHKFIIGDLNYHKGRGDTETTKPHVLVFSEGRLGQSRMNRENKTDGGYTGSEMWKYIIPKYAEAFQNAFGSSHILSHRELLTKTTSPTGASAAGAGWVGTTTDWEWTSVLVNLFNEVMIYGCHPNSSSLYDVGDCCQQVAAFRHDKKLQTALRTWNWLRAVASASHFAGASVASYAAGTSASHAGGGVRPYALLT